ncbi:MAG: hypothetical protein JO154_05670 [Chitinophaga sp.]|uniref:fibronectin type III domain-containing protein n=1 Tax=Chitinophaga sp. TaxID=1869181 RepID=UPI0025B861A7|nr:hypothetical protein [Chitinophaga sp.]MBV8252077.1 hypothetical protein [Chitinophaga sp.]
MRVKCLYKIGLIVVLLAWVLQATAQQRPGVMMIGKVRKGSVMLRWAPTTPRIWKQANVNGYTLERYTIIRNGKVLDHPERIVLTNSPVKPLPMPAWQAISDTSDFGAIVAQAIYGESFKTDLKQGDAMSVVNRSTELEQRFAYSLFACDRSFTVAGFAGLAFTDKTIKKEEKYLYRIYANLPDKMKADTGSVFIGMMDEAPLPKPLDLGALFADKAVMLSWNYVLLKESYNSYILERSEGEHAPFKQINKEPIVNANEKDSSIPSRIYYVDSLGTNFKMYWYRVRGLDAFGEMGPPSDTVKGEGLPSLPYNPKITASNINKSNKVDLSWDFPAAGDSLITGFSIIRAAAVKGPYDTLQRNIPVRTRKWELAANLLPSNYIAVVAVGKNGTVAPSFPVLVQPEDTIPPAVPIQLKGTVDSTGVVRIHWAANTEPDLMGYRVFRGSKKEAEFIQLTSTPIADTMFRDTIQMNNIAGKIYYKITASDKRYNQSDFSAILELQRPDIIPPTAPAFKNYEIKDGKVKLIWVNSQDADVVRYRLLRREKDPGNASWQLVKEFIGKGALLDSLQETPPAFDKSWQYTLQAQDSAGLNSDYATPVTILIPANAAIMPIPQLKAQVDRENKRIQLHWKLDYPGVAQFWIYRAGGKTPMSVLQVLDASQLEFNDTIGLEINNTYQYTLKAVMQNGQQSRFAPVLMVNY